jgi:hypothetical protein
MASTIAMKCTTVAALASARPTARLVSRRVAKTVVRSAPEETTTSAEAGSTYFFAGKSYSEAEVSHGRYPTTHCAHGRSLH